MVRCGLAVWRRRRRRRSTHAGWPASPAHQFVAPRLAVNFAASAGERWCTAMFDLHHLFISCRAVHSNSPPLPRGHQCRGLHAHGLMRFMLPAPHVSPVRCSCRSIVARPAASKTIAEFADWRVERGPRVREHRRRAAGCRRLAVADAHEQAGIRRHRRGPRQWKSSRGFQQFAATSVRRSRIALIADGQSVERGRAG